jgi:hypothetical protein
MLLIQVIAKHSSIEQLDHGTSTVSPS